MRDRDIGAVTEGFESDRHLISAGSEFRGMTQQVELAPTRVSQV
jgi:hypothetical protein